MKRRVVVVSECQSKNLGDKAIFLALSEIISPKFYVVEASLGELKRVGEDEGLSKKRRFRIIREVARNLIPARAKAFVRWHLLGGKRRFFETCSGLIAGSDLVIVGGGQLIRNSSSLFCEKIAVISKESKRKLIPLAFVGVGVDENMDFFNWITVRGAIKYSAFFAARDQMSVERLRAALPAPVGCLVIPDLVFSLRPQRLPTSRGDLGESLAINVMNLRSMVSQKYPNKIDYMAGEIARKFIEVLSHYHRQGLPIEIFTTGSADDLIEALNFQNKVRDLVGIDVPVFHPTDVDDLLNFLRKKNHILASRMHAGILSYIAGANPLCLNWDEKVIGVWSEVGEVMRVIDLDGVISVESGESILRRFRNQSPATTEGRWELSEGVRRRVLEKVSALLDGND